MAMKKVYYNPNYHPSNERYISPKAVIAVIVLLIVVAGAISYLALKSMEDKQQSIINK